MISIVHPGIKWQIVNYPLKNAETRSHNHWSKLEVKYYQQDVRSGCNIHETIKQDEVTVDPLVTITDLVFPANPWGWQ